MRGGCGGCGAWASLLASRRPRQPRHSCSCAAGLRDAEEASHLRGWLHPMPRPVLPSLRRPSRPIPGALAACQAAPRQPWAALRVFPPAGAHIPTPAWTASEQPPAGVNRAHSLRSGAFSQRAGRQGRRGGAAPPRGRAPAPCALLVSCPPCPGLRPPRPCPCRPRQAGCSVDRRAGGPVPQGARAGRRRVVSGEISGRSARAVDQRERCVAWLPASHRLSGLLLPPMAAPHLCA